MPNYKVKIKETLEMEVEIEAEDRVEAEYLVSRQYHKGEYILDADHYKGVQFKAQRADRDRGANDR